MSEKKHNKGRLGAIYYIIFFMIISAVFCSSLHAHSDCPPISCLGSGVDKFNVTYAAPSMFTCGNLGCHYQYPVNIGKAKFNLFVKDKCEPGEIVDILVSFEKTTTEFHGFEITAQDFYFDRLVGTFINVEGGDDTQIIGSEHFVTHTKKGTSQKFWHVKWQSPPANTFVANPVRFYAMGIEANNDGTSMGDYVYKATRLVTVEKKKIQKPQVRTIKKK